jgi:nitric oxide reductase NorQ protein
MAVKARPSARTRAKAKTERLASVPDISYFKNYISRQVVPGLSEFDIFDNALEKNHNVLIEGPTGPGKTSAALAYAAKRNMHFYAVASNIGVEPSQLFGKLIPNDDGNFAWVDGPVTDIVRYGGVLLINEVNFIPDRVATVLFGLLDKRRSVTLLDHKGEVIEAHPDLLILADMNPEYEGTRPLNKAFRNRFAIQLWWDYDPAVEAKLVRSKELRTMAEKFRNAQKAGDYETPCSTNMLIEFETFMGDMGWAFAKMNFVNHFAQDERGAASQVIDTFRAGLERDLLTKKRDTDPTEEDMDDDEPMSDADRARIKKLPKAAVQEDDDDPWVIDEDRTQHVVVDGSGIRYLIDSEDGIFGVDWEYSEDDE